jgi:hypothetical protein
MLQVQLAKGATMHGAAAAEPAATESGEAWAEAASQWAESAVHRLICSHSPEGKPC